MRADDESVINESPIPSIRPRCLVFLSAILTAGVLIPTVHGRGQQSPPAADPGPTPSSDETAPRYLGAMPNSKAKSRTSSSSSSSSSSPRRYQPDQVLSLDLKPVEQGIADRGPLDGGMRWINLGLQLPSGYRQCFERPGGGFMRADGGLVATFQQSIYMQSKEGLMPDIPASTTFVIGGVPLAGEVGHGRLLPVDPLDPGRGPSPAEGFAPRVAPDEAWVVTATPGDRLGRFGYGAGYRVAAVARPSHVTESDENLVEPRPLAKSTNQPTGITDRAASSAPSRFFADPSYRRDRMRSLAASFTNAIKRRGLRNAAPSTTGEIEPNHSRWADVPRPRP